jgi:transposase
MLMKNRGKLEPCYNSHVAVDEKNHFIADYNVTNISADSNKLSSIAKSAKDALGVERVEAAADRGFFDAKELKECVDNGVTPYVPEQRRFNSGS